MRLEARPLESERRSKVCQLQSLRLMTLHLSALQAGCTQTKSPDTVLKSESVGAQDKMRLMRSAVVVEDVEADEAPSGRAGEGYTDLREFLSRKKRTREGDVPMEDSRPSRLQAKGQRGSVLR